MSTTTTSRHGEPADSMAPTGRLRDRRRFAIGLLGAAAACTAAADVPDEAARNRQLVDAAFARWASGGTGFFTDMLHDDVVWTIKGSGPSAGTHHGRQAFLDRAVAPFVARMRKPVMPVATEVWADGDHVIVRWDGEGVAGDGQPYRNSYVWIFRMRGGRAIEATAFLDLAAYDDVLRRVPARG